MSLFEMSLAGGAMVLAVVLARALLLNKLPKATFVLLWALVAVRLLIPVAVPSPVSIASLVQRGVESQVASVVSSQPLAPAPSPTANPTTFEPSILPAPRTEAPTASEVSGVSNPEPAFVIAWDQVIPGVWALGAALCAGAFGITYLRCRREFRTSLPVGHPEAGAWLAEHQKELRRPLTLRQSDLVATPLTYGICKPVILVPKTCDWSAREQMDLMLAHELVHVRRFDAATKLLLIACVCIHWFNPLVWVMYVLANRDLELSCDERVVRSCGTGTRATYARTLIAMEETKSGLAPLYSGFSKTATKERIVAIMHIKKTSLVALATSASLIVGIPAALATSAMPSQDAPEQTRATPLSAPYSTDDWNTVVSKNRYSADDWSLVQALNVPDVESLTVEAFTDLALEVADTPEKRDRLIAILDDPAIYTQAPTNETARFVTNVLVPVLRENSRFFGALPEDDNNGASADAHWLGTGILVSADTVVGPLSPLGEALAEAGYSGSEVGYWISAHVLDANAITVGAYVQAIEDTRHAIDSLVDWDLVPTWQKDAGVKITAALEDIAANQSSADLLMEANWFFVSNANGMLTLGNSEGDASEALAGLPDDGSDATAELLASYIPLGLSYTFDTSAEEFVLTMEFGEQPVRSIYDEHRGAWIANSTNEFRLGSEAVDLVAVYEGDRLVGLRENTEFEQEALDAQRRTTTAEILAGAEAEEATLVAAVPLAAVNDETATAGAAEDLQALNAQYEAFDLVYDKATQSYLYQEEPVRYLFDGHVIDTNDDGTAASYATRNEYYNPRGTVDVHVVRATEYGADGSRNHLGEIVGVAPFTAAQENLAASLVEGYLARGTNQASTTEAEDDIASEPAAVTEQTTTPGTTGAQGLTVAGRLEPFLAYGLVYQNGNMTLNGTPVNAFVDMNQSGVFSYTSSTQYADGLYLRAVYTSDGTLTGLKEFDPGTAFVEE